MSEEEIDRLIHDLDSLLEGGFAAEMLVLCGQRAVPHLAEFLLKGPPRTISLPRCRAVHALGDLGARSALISYFKEYRYPVDPEALFAEDAVRSAAAQELARYPSAEVFRVLLDAAWQRPTGRLVLALGSFQRPESVPLLFNILEDDICREDAMNSLRKIPDSVRQFGILSIRGSTGVSLDGPGNLCRRRATLQLLSEVGIDRRDWPDLRQFLFTGDPGSVLSVAKVGLSVACDGEHPEIVAALLEAAAKFNFLQEGDAEELLDSHPAVARQVALRMATQRQAAGEKPKWSSPFWRIVNHMLGHVFERGKTCAS